jgi:cytochrome P450/glutathione S-transferase
MASWYSLTSVAISPFCELARWSLDRLGIPYREECHAPIWNVPFTKLAGGGVNVPVVRAPDAVLDARALLDYLEARCRDDERLFPSDPDARREVTALVDSLCGDLAIAVRRYAYANMLPNRSVTARLMTTRVPWIELVLVHLFYPLQAAAMRRVLSITPASTERARVDIIGSFDRLSARIDGAHPFLFGAQLTAADVTLAAVSAPVTLPPEYGAPLPAFADLPPAMQETVRAVRASRAGELCLRVYREARRPVHDALATAPSAGETPSVRRRQWLQRALTSPRVLRPLFAALRFLRPVWTLGGTSLVTRFDDVVELLDRDKEFTIAEVNGKRMDRISGPFILGMDRSPQHDREAAAIQAVIKRDDLTRIERIVVGAADEAIAAAAPSGRLDLAENYARRVASRVVSEYFGVPGPNEHILQQWMRSLFWDVFLNRNDDPLVRRAADASARELREHLVALIAARHGTRGDDLLSRLVHAGTLDDDAVRRNITGIIVGVVDTTVTATVNAIDWLLDAPDALAQTKQAVTAKDSAHVLRCTLEALRFQPQTPALLRFTKSDATLRSGARIAKGQNVVALTLSAMFDPDAFSEPGCFRADRDPHQYLHFGSGLHTCYGRMINQVQIPALVSRVLMLPGLRRAEGPAGRTAFEGPFRDRLVVAFGAQR